MTFEEVCKQAIVDSYERLLADNARMRVELEMAWDIVQEEATEAQQALDKLAQADVKLACIEECIKTDTKMSDLIDHIAIVLNG